MEKNSTTITGDEPNNLSAREKFFDALTTVWAFMVILLCYIGAPIGLFAFCKYVLGLSLPWWTIIFSPIWFFLAAYIPGGFVITTAILWIFKAMLVPWWVWTLSIICSIFVFLRTALISWKKDFIFRK